MPHIDKHIKSSMERTGKEYREIHEWIDGDPEKKVERHDVTKIYAHGKFIEDNYGKEALQEYIQHLHDDIWAKFTHIQHDFEKAIPEVLSYFGIRKRDGEGVSYKIQHSDIDLLRKAGVSEDDISHCVKVSEKALEIAQRIGATMDMELVGRGALFHDLGKARTHAIEHGMLGAELGRSFGLPDAVTDIMEKHIRGGLTEEEARELGLPVRDYTLRRIEEKIVIYADRLVDIITDGIVPIKAESEAEARFEEILKDYSKYGKNEKTLQRYLGYHREIQGLLKGK